MGFIQLTIKKRLKGYEVEIKGTKKQVNLYQLKKIKKETDLNNLNLIINYSLL